MSLPLVSAQGLPAPPFAVNQVTNILTTMLKGNIGGGEDLVARLLIFVLLTAILVQPAKKIVGDRIGGVVAILVAMMSVRYLTDQMIGGLFLPNQALGITLSILLPFILFEGFILGIDNLPQVFRTIGHLMMAGIFIGMWWFRWTDIGDLAYYYIAGTVLSLIALWFDKDFRVWMAQSRIGDRQKGQALIRSIELEKERQKLLDDVITAEAAGDTAAANAARRRSEVLYRALNKLYKMQ